MQNRTKIIKFSFDSWRLQKKASKFSGVLSSIYFFGIMKGHTTSLLNSIRVLPVIAVDYSSSLVFNPPIVHLKGFGKGLDFRDQTVRALRDDCVNTLARILHKGGTLVWDGDSFQKGMLTLDDVFKIHPKRLKNKTKQQQQKKRFVYVTYSISAKNTINKVERKRKGSKGQEFK
ncbi:hypothetical protein RFI_08668 [Reticulomyxa filosa]|uniref:Uncharacterized protein n=1 Tax=Reticulomyxa filosa TaxID=46433 RepID=X6NRC3_RETFI|nr:hypothetical protein RFI_08668 [Reticulomyxa filosa]|eukprot:ETO28468.1 hypothetical protein RFI_08668 [Reticulomyxa filosa]